MGVITTEKRVRFFSESNNEIVLEPVNTFKISQKHLKRGMVKYVNYIKKAWTGCYSFTCMKKSMWNDIFRIVFTLIIILHSI